MSKSDLAKEKIIAAATELIKESGGKADMVTIRAIAEKAEVGTGLINYHFKSKDELITVCVQRIINGVVTGYTPTPGGAATDGERLCASVSEVFEFLFKNPEISRISILGDYADFAADSNTVMTAKGLSTLIKDIPDAGARLHIALILTAAIQSAFLSAAHSKELFGLDFSVESDRRVYIKKTVALLLH